MGSLTEDCRAYRQFRCFSMPRRTGGSARHTLHAPPAAWYCARDALTSFPCPCSRRTFMPFDLVLRGGRVIDPSQKFDAVADVAFAGGKVAAVGSALKADPGTEVRD